MHFQQCNFWGLFVNEQTENYKTNTNKNKSFQFNLLAPELFFYILAHPVYKMWIKQEPNMLELWNKLHFEEKKRRVYNVFKIFSTYICWINI